jgi:membrane protein implicated in regulation of membrane protease activity
MGHLFDLVWGFGAWNWLYLVVALFLLDLVIPGGHFLWFRFAAVGVGILALATGIAWQWQVVAFGVFSVAAALMVRTYVRPAAVTSDAPELNTGGEQYVGRWFVVQEAIECGRGKVRVGDTLWSAEGPDALAGASVKVTGVRGTVLVVERAASISNKE